MAAKVQWYRNAWWVVVHDRGKRIKKRIGPSKEDKRRATEAARKANALIVARALGISEVKRENPIACDVELRRWHLSYAPTMKKSYEELTRGHIHRHLIPHFGSTDLRRLTESNLLEFIRAKLDDGLSPKTISNILSTLRRVLSLLEREAKLPRNPAINIGQLMRRVDRATAVEDKGVEYWTRREVQILLELSRTHEPRFAPLFQLLFATGMRRGEAIGLKWSDIDFDRKLLTVRRAIVRGLETTPKSGRSRRVPMTPTLASGLFDLLADRRQECLRRGWSQVPDFVLCSLSGSALNERYVGRVWDRLRRRAQKHGVRPLKLHSARHTWATLALQAGKSVRWVADQLGHADPALTLRVYAHAMRDEERDLSFADFGSTERHYAAPEREEPEREEPNPLKELARREGLEPPTLRFEAGFA